MNTNLNAIMNEIERHFTFEDIAGMDWELSNLQIEFWANCRRYTEEQLQEVAEWMENLSSALPNFLKSVETERATNILEVFEGIQDTFGYHQSRQSEISVEENVTLLEAGCPKRSYDLAS